jgi:hypothetical protein
MSVKSLLYERDFFAWSRQQAELLRAGKLADADIEHIAEEIDSMGRTEKPHPICHDSTQWSSHYGASDPLSLMARLRQAQGAFVYGVPLAALALMRSILELLFKKHYGWDQRGLLASIKAANAKSLLPTSIHFVQLQQLLKLGNDAVHTNPEELHNIADIEREVHSLLFILRTLIEGAPKSAHT